MSIDFILLFKFTPDTALQNAPWLHTIVKKWCKVLIVNSIRCRRWLITLGIFHNPCNGLLTSWNVIDKTSHHSTRPRPCIHLSILHHRQTPATSSKTFAIWILSPKIRSFSNNLWPQYCSIPVRYFVTVDYQSGIKFACPEDCLLHILKDRRPLVAINRVPMFIPSAPIAKDATKLRPSAIPPEETNGMVNPSQHEATISYCMSSSLDAHHSTIYGNRITTNLLCF